MKKMFAVLVAALSLSAIAADSPKHQVYVTSSGLGWSGSATKADGKSSSNFKTIDVMEGTFALNYAYFVIPKLQIGAALERENTETETKLRPSGKEEVTEMSVELTLSVTWNFSEDAFDSFYTGLALTGMRSEDKTKDGTGTTKEKGTASSFSLYGGKRWSLKSIGLENVTYSPMITVGKIKYGKDLKYIEDSTFVRLDLIKFDVLF